MTASTVRTDPKDKRSLRPSGLPESVALRRLRALGSWLGDERRSTRLVLLFALISGVSYTVSMALESPEQFGLASDVYTTAAEAYLEGGEPYGVAPSHLPGYHFLYPPINLVVFLPYGVLGDTTLAYGGQLLVNLVVAYGLYRVIGRGLARRAVELARVDRVLVFLFIAVSTWSVPHFIMGQTTLWIGLLFAIGILAIERNRDTLAGGVFAAAALIKVFPAAIGLWLLRLRKWRAVAIAIGTGLLGMALGLVLLGPELTLEYLTEVLPDRFEGQTFGGTVAPGDPVGGIRRQLAGLFGLSGIALSVTAAVIVGGVLAVCLRDVSSDLHRTGAVLATILAVFFFVPLQPLYFALALYPTAILLYTLPRGRARWSLLAGVALTATMLEYETTVDAWQGVPIISDPMIDLITEVFTVALPTDIGMWLLLLGCVFIQLDYE